ncbi:MAG: tRNA pseudouridine(55) synthase TruB [Eubacteriaceae bacterium]|nr:tRNA pseudouridine(55) synthase TruB [Eubacteriaceae bacterium]
MNSVIVLNKSAGMTSFSACRRVASILGEKKAGHAGTLDPNASGVLIVCTGSTSRLIEYFPKDSKEYIAGIRFGMVSDTQDIWGEVIRTCSPAFSAEELEEALHSFTGKIEQQTPAYSARKLNGRPFYEYARKGVETQRPVRTVTIEQIELISADIPMEAEIRVRCSEGTYIRTLADDIGRKLGCGAVMSSLVRTKCCRYDMTQAHTLEEISAAVSSGTVGDLLLSPDDPIRHLPKAAVCRSYEEMMLTGAEVPLSGFTVSSGTLVKGCTVRLYAEGGFSGIGIVTENGIKPKKVMVDAK